MSPQVVLAFGILIATMVTAVVGIAWRSKRGSKQTKAPAAAWAMIVVAVVLILAISSLILLGIG